MNRRKTIEKCVHLVATLVARRSYSFRVVFREVGSAQEERSANSSDFTSGSPETPRAMRDP
jgi:hypothetical protein